MGLVLIGFLRAPLMAQQQPIQIPQPTPVGPPNFVDDSVVKIFELKHVEPNGLKSILSVFPAQINSAYSGRGYVLSVKASKPVMDAVEEMIKRFDVPPPPPPPTPEKKNAELAIYVVVPTDAPINNNAMPAALKPVLDQINTLFNYKGFHLLDTLLVRSPVSRPGEGSSQASASGTLALPSPAVSTYTFNANFLLRTTEGAQPYLFLDDMSFLVKVPRVPAPSTPEMFYSVGITSDVEIKTGQHVVVGKTQAGGTSLILIMSARFLDSGTPGGTR
jgi:hypothetical protein